MTTSSTGYCDWCGTTRPLGRAGLLAAHDYDEGRCNGTGSRPVRASTYTPIGATVHLPDTPGETP
jgi:hypothetical protein